MPRIRNALYYSETPLSGEGPRRGLGRFFSWQGLFFTIIIIIIINTYMYIYIYIYTQYIKIVNFLTISQEINLARILTISQNFKTTI